MNKSVSAHPVSGVDHCFVLVSDLVTGSIPLTFPTSDAFAGAYRNIDTGAIPPTAFVEMQIATDNPESIRQNSLSEQLSMVETPRCLAVPAALASGVIVEFVAK